MTTLAINHHHPIGAHAVPKPFACLLAAMLLAGCAAPLAPAPATGKAPRLAKASAQLSGAAIFDRLDASDDGKLSLPEFRELGIFGVNGLLFDPAPHPPLPEAQAATFASFDKNRDQAVSAAEFENFGVALHYALAFDSPAELHTTMFPTLDLDHDGRLTPAEWTQLGIFGVPFAGLDRDRDGFLVLGELAGR